MGQPLLSQSGGWNQIVSNAKSLVQHPLTYLSHAASGMFNADPTGASGMVNPMGAAGTMMGPMSEGVKGLISGLSDYNSAVGKFAKLYSDKYGMKILPSDIHQALDHYHNLFLNADHVQALQNSGLPEHQALVMAHKADMEFGHQQFPELMQFIRQHHMKEGQGGLEQMTPGTLFRSFVGGGLEQWKKGLLSSPEFMDNLKKKYLGGQE